MKLLITQFSLVSTYVSTLRLLPDSGAAYTEHRETK